VLQFHFSGEGLHIRLDLLCLLAREEQAPIAKTLLSILGRIYFWTGLGFNVNYVCCDTVSRSVTWTPLKNWKKWGQWEGHVLECTPLKENSEWSKRTCKNLAE
jgi:hypothetical protein